jgi:hypothetical protein
MRLHRKLGGLLAAALLAAGLTAAAVPARAAENTVYYQLVTGPTVNTSVPECLTADTGQTVTQHFCDPNPAVLTQLWRPIEFQNFWEFQNRATGLCLWAFEVGPPHNGVPITMSSCFADDTNSEWQISRSTFPVTEAIASKVAGSTGFCLDVPGASITVGLQLQLFQCNGTAAQQFRITNPVVLPVVPL